MKWQKCHLEDIKRSHNKKIRTIADADSSPKNCGFLQLSDGKTMSLRDLATDQTFHGCCSHPLLLMLDSA